MPPAFALTFDDGPDPTWTPLLLDALDRAGARATFFPLSSRVADHPGLLAEAIARGHEVGLHGWAHLRHPDRTRAEVVDDTRRALAVLEPAPRWWRLPWGLPAPWTEAVAGEFGMRVVGWTHDTHDWRGDDAGQMLAAVRHLHDGAVVLAHDGVGPGATRTGCGQTVALVEPLVEAAREAGLEPATIGDLTSVPAASPG